MSSIRRFVLGLSTFFVVATSLFAASATQHSSVSHNSASIVLNDISIDDFIKLVAKVTQKNILLTYSIPGKVNFISTTPVKKEDLFNLLLSVLDAKGFTLVPQGRYLKIVRSVQAAKEGLPFVPNMPSVMRTSVIKINNASVDLVAAKVRQFLSAGGKIITLKEANAMVVADYPKNIDIIKRIVRFIDTDPSARMRIKFIPLKYAKASNIVAKVTKMVKSTINQKIPVNKIDILSDDATNSIILIASQENINKLLPYIKRLDAKDLTNSLLIDVVQLQNAEAKSIATTLQELIAKKKYPKEELKPTISVDEEMNSLVVMATGEDIQKIRAMVKLLDRERPQVYVKAKIVEISESKMRQLGIKYGLEAGKVTSDALFTLGTNLGGSSIVSSTLESMIKLPSEIREGLALGAFIDFLSTQGAAEILSEPSLLCVNNKESFIYVGKTEPVLVSSVQGNNTTDLARNTYQRQDIGLTLKVKPRISSGNKVTITTDVILEDTVGSSAPGLPVTTKRKVQTVAIVNNGESVILGGLIKSKYSDSITKIPLLGDIPILGRIFRNTHKTKDNVNLVIILTPYIVKNSKELGALRQKLRRLNKMEKEYYKILIHKFNLKKNDNLKKK